MQPLRAEHGPSLPLDQQLRRLLESQVFHAVAVLRPFNGLFRDVDACLRFLERRILVA